MNHKLSWAGVVLVVLAVLGPVAPSALAKPQPNPAYLPFKECPAKTKGVIFCLVATTTGGEVKMGNKSVPIEHPIILQGGVSKYDEYLVPATGQTLISPPQTVPGGLAGIEGIGGEVTARTELAEPPSTIAVNEANSVNESGIAVRLPLKVHLENETLGSECYVGGTEDPIVLKLTTGTTSPPSPNTPISGSKGKLSISEGGNIVELSGVSLVDNSFAAPEATGCGGALSFLVNPLVNSIVGLPSAAGKNTAILSGSLLLAPAKAVRAAHVLPKT
jgi:hypothetical protein